MNNIILLSQQNAILLVLGISIIFVILGIVYSKKFKGLNNYLLANRSVGTFSLTSSLVASALGAWILFGPASAATWGGIGAVIGYALGTAFPLFILIYLGTQFREKYPKGKTLIEVIRLKYGPNLFKLILVLSIFYMTIFLIAEVTAVSMLINYISGTDLWITALIVIISSLIYTLYGGLRASIFTDNIQFLFLIVLLLVTFSYVLNFNKNEFNFDYTYGEIIHVEGPVQDFETILKLINLVQSDTFRINKILFSYTNGWDIVSKDTKIRFGKNITNKKLRNFKNTINYLLDIEKIPSIIDLRNKDGVALNYGSK